MPSMSARASANVETEPPVESYGQVIEYIQDRLYLASYTHAPNEQTPFPYPSQQQSPGKRSSKSQQGPVEVPKPTKSASPIYFSIDRTLLYNAFHADFGPLHIGHLYRFAVELHEVLGNPDNNGRHVVFWTHSDSRSRANAACMLAVYMVLVQSWPPHLALAPISQMDPPLMPFRDAGYSQADYILNVQDVVYGVWRAKEEGLVGLKDFNLEEYERFERVDMGDFNWIGPKFVAFASPQHQPIAEVSPTSPEFAELPKSTMGVMNSKLPGPFKNVLAHFRSRHVGLVVRLNSQLYSPSYFTALGITHIDMIFDDGTCPTLPMVKKFIRLAHETITVKRRGVAVHCKAGLGRTGCLIGAYLIYRHGFTANEVIAYMRFMRPGMVVGPQQHWLHLNQGTFRQWWYEDMLKEKLALQRQSTPPRMTGRAQSTSNGQNYTPPNGSIKRRALGELDYNEGSATASVVQDEYLPAPTPGQPRKTSKLYGERHNPYTDGENDLPCIQPETQYVSLERHMQGESESEEEYQLRMLSRKITRSPSGSHKKRAVSCTTTTTTEWSYPSTLAAKTPISNRTASGSGALSINKANSVRRSGGIANGVRKTSARMGSVSVLANSSNTKQ